MNPIDEYVSFETRRQFLGKAAKGLGIAALASIVGPGLRGSASRSPGFGPGTLGMTHFPAKAKRGIYLFMSGAPSQLDMYDYKPEMQSMFDKDLPDSVRRGQRLTTMTSGQARFGLRNFVGSPASSMGCASSACFDQNGASEQSAIDPAP